jgi:hypothetical protein
MIDTISRPVATVRMSGTSVLEFNPVEEVCNIAEACEVWLLVKFVFQGPKFMDKVVSTMERSISGQSITVIAVRKYIT